MAILAVVSCHVVWPIPWSASITISPLDVHHFFPLSGFLITWRLIQYIDRSGHIDWADFYRRRVFRILPAAFVYLFVIAVIGLDHLIPLTRLELAGAALFFRNYLCADIRILGTRFHFWSLSVEEHFLSAVAAAARARGFSPCAISRAAVDRRSRSLARARQWIPVGLSRASIRF